MNKHDNFLRIATNRQEQIIKKIASLKNLNNTSFYEYSEKEIIALFKDIEEEIKETKIALLNKKKSAFKQISIFSQEQAKKGQ